MYTAFRKLRFLDLADKFLTVKLRFPRFIPVSHVEILLFLGLP